MERHKRELPPEPSPEVQASFNKSFEAIESTANNLAAALGISYDDAFDAVQKCVETESIMPVQVLINTRREAYREFEKKQKLAHAELMRKLFEACRDYEPCKYGEQKDGHTALVPIQNSGPRVGRNAKCPCGSGMKAKKCKCGKKFSTGNRER